MTRALPLFTVIAVLISFASAHAGIDPEEIRQIAMVEGLEQTYAHAPFAVTRHGPQLWAAATVAGHTRVLSWLASRHIPGSEIVSPQGFNLWFIAAIEGHVHVLVWLQLNKIPGRDAIAADGRNLREIAEAAEEPEVVRWLDSSLSPSQIQTVLAAIPPMFLAFSRASAIAKH